MLKLYYFKDKVTGKERNTAVVAHSAKAAKAKLRQPSPKRAIVSKVRTPNATEKKQIAAGRWVRTRSNGKPPSSDRKRGYGPPRRKKRSKGLILFPNICTYLYKPPHFG